MLNKSLLLQSLSNNLFLHHLFLLFFLLLAGLLLLNGLCVIWAL